MALPDEPAHDPAGNAFSRSARLVQLPNGAVAQTLPDAHTGKRPTSSTLEVKRISSRRSQRGGKTETALDRGAGRAQRCCDDCAALLRQAWPGAASSAPVGRRRYAESAVAEVGAIRFLREVGFSLAEIASFLTAADGRARREIIDRKLAEVAEQLHRLEVAREALVHGQRCAAGDPMSCSRFWSIIGGHLGGRLLEESHELVH